MVRYLRFVSLLSCFLVVVGLTALAARPARAGSADPQTTGGTAILCWGYNGCARAGMGNAGYASVNNRMYWRMFSGHNCTNYAAYRMVHAGMPNVRPWTGSGNATNWGVAMSRITDGRPAVGAVAWWRAYHSTRRLRRSRRLRRARGQLRHDHRVPGQLGRRVLLEADHPSRWPVAERLRALPRRALRNTAQPKVTGTPRSGRSSPRPPAAGRCPA